MKITQKCVFVNRTLTNLDFMISYLADKHNGQGVHSVMNLTVASNDGHEPPRVFYMLSRVKPHARILETCQEAFSASPAFAAYLAKRIAEQNGSVLVAQLFVNQFRLCFPDSLKTVSPEQVIRLGVDHDPSAVMHMFEALHHSGFRIMEALIRLEINLKGDIESDDGEHYAQPEHKAVDLAQLVPFQNLFICASAMLAGVTIDPRAQAA